MAFTFYTYCGNIMRSCYVFVYLYVCFVHYWRISFHMRMPSWTKKPICQKHLVYTLNNKYYDEAIILN